ncbi:DUF192 domain-containing protein [Wenzhouxiangella limi]|uniref:DUF192 domain-containing protein n=1 Tax=Wenzhouxiangella limi TaxID=2707351 RepID=A0A845V011_9GAMM|nr:DUF192 domain-containing protein [Wenzhouxiangella limi]NDY95530.1 DUF192 domain-containing protein [Wenzhouxiangella limi]
MTAFARYWLLPLCALLALSACRAEEPWVEVNGQRFEVEIAADDQSRAMGLMFRDELAEDRGMFFLFRREAPRSFWMMNTRIPLDIIYLDRELRVVSIVANARPCRRSPCPSYPSRGPAQFVLELNAGQAAAMGLEPGDQLSVAGIDLDSAR